jgi:hypothetical protein
VGTTGVIFVAIAIAWLAYLVPHFVRRREGEPVQASDPANRFSDSVRIVQRGTAPLLDQDLAEITSYEVSTPLTRQAAVGDLRRLERLAASRRRRALMALLAATSAVIGVCAVPLLPWWVAAIPGGLLGVFVLVARLSLWKMRRGLDARYKGILLGSNEATVFLSRKDVKQAVAAAVPAARGASKSEPIVKPGGLWDPVPITLPTYVSKPLAPRTVRTIDLSGADVTSSGRQSVPVTADAQILDRSSDRKSTATGRDEAEAASA